MTVASHFFGRVKTSLSQKFGDLRMSFGERDVDIFSFNRAQLADEIGKLFSGDGAVLVSVALGYNGRPKQGFSMTFDDKIDEQIVHVDLYRMGQATVVGWLSSSTHISTAPSEFDHCYSK